MKEDLPQQERKNNEEEKQMLSSSDELKKYREHSRSPGSVAEMLFQELGFAKSRPVAQWPVAHGPEAQS